MQEIRGPGHPVPDSIPEDLVATYGARARHTVRYRRSWRYRQARRIGRLMQGRDPWFVTAAGLLWALIVAAFTASIVLLALRWPSQVLDAGVIVAVALLSSFLTAIAYRRRGIREAH